MKKTFIVSFGLIFGYIQGQDLKLIKSFSIGKESVKNISISGDCKIIGAASATEVKVWNLNSGKEIVFDSAKDLIHFGNSSTTALCNSNVNIKTFKALTGKLAFDLEGRQEIMNYAKLSPSLNFIYCIGETGNVSIWSAETGKLINTIKVSGIPLTKLSVSNSGKTLIVSDISKTIHVVDLLSSSVTKSIKGIEDEIKCLLFGKADSVIYFITANDKLFRQNILSDTQLESTFLLNAKCIDVSPDGKYIAIGNKTNAIIILSENLKQVSKTEDSAGNITDVAFGNDGKKIFSSYDNGRINCYDAVPFKIVASSYYLDNYLSKINIASIDFIDENNNKLLDPNEKAKVSITLTNTGKTTVNDSYLQFSTKIKEGRLNSRDTVQVGEMLPGSKKQIYLQLNSAATTSREALKFIVKNKYNEFYTDTIKYAVNFAPDKPSEITILKHSIVSDNSKIQKGKQFKLKISFLNPTKVIKENIKASFVLPANVTVYEDKKLAITSLKSNENIELEYGLIVNDSYSSDSILLKIQVTENSGSVELPLTLIIQKTEQNVTKNNQMVTEGNVKGGGTLMRGSGDPLKGINIANANNKEIKPGKYYALIIGIDNYKGTWVELKNAVGDAKALESTLRDKYKFDLFKTLYNDQATRTQIITQLEWLSDNAKENDNVLIYYSGHGEYKKQFNKGFWVPADATTNSTAQFISNSEIQTFLKGIKSKHTLLISDACFSGDIFRGNTVSEPFENNDKYYANVYEKVSRQAISSGGIEPVMDGGKEGHSVFSYYLLKALTGNSAKYYDASQLFEKVKIPVINNSEQTPNFNAIKNTDDEGGHFIFIKK